MKEKEQSFAIVVPCFNDWESLRILIEEFIHLPQNCKLGRLVVVNDGSTEQSTIGENLSQKPNFQIECLNLSINMGHQFAISAGIQSLLKSDWEGTIVVMDSDGEDDPGLIDSLNKLILKNPETVAVARRGKRPNGRVFKIFYGSYRKIFRFLTGKRLNFGNFMAISNNQASRLILIDDTWNHLAASVLKHCPEINMITVNRRNRFAGKSRMNFISLVGHGLAALAVFAEVIFIRMIFTAISLLFLCLFVACLVLYLKFYTNSSIPGWTTNVLGFSILIAFQTVAILFTTTISLLLAKKKLDTPNYISAQEFISK